MSHLCCGFPVLHAKRHGCFLTSGSAESRVCKCSFVFLFGVVVLGKIVKLKIRKVGSAAQKWSLPEHKFNCNLENKVIAYQNLTPEAWKQQDCWMQWAGEVFFLLTNFACDACGDRDVSNIMQYCEYSIPLQLSLAVQTRLCPLFISWLFHS